MRWLQVKCTMILVQFSNVTGFIWSQNSSSSMNAHCYLFQRLRSESTNLLLCFTWGKNPWQPLFTLCANINWYILIFCVNVSCYIPITWSALWLAVQNPLSFFVIYNHKGFDRLSHFLQQRETNFSLLAESSHHWKNGKSKALDYECINPRYTWLMEIADFV